MNAEKKKKKAITYIPTLHTYSLLASYRNCNQVTLIDLALSVARWQLVWSTRVPIQDQSRTHISRIQDESIKEKWDTRLEKSNNSLVSVPVFLELYGLQSRALMIAPAPTLLPGSGYETITNQAIALSSEGLCTRLLLSDYYFISLVGVMLKREISNIYMKKNHHNRKRKSALWIAIAQPIR